MRALKIDFTKTGQARLVFDQEVAGAQNAGQKAAVNIVTRRGSDSIHALRGTTLQEEAANGVLVGVQSAGHATNFAGLETRKFARAIAPASATPSDLPKRVSLQLQAFENGLATTNLFLELDSGETFGTELNSVL